MGKTIKAFARQLLSPPGEALRKSLLAGGVLFLAVYAADLRLSIAPEVLYLTSALYSAGILWHTLGGRALGATVRGMLVLPLENRELVLSYAAALTGHTLLTKTLPLWAVFLAAAPWRAGEVAAALGCGGNGCLTAAALYGLFRGGRRTGVGAVAGVGTAAGTGPAVWAAAAIWAAGTVLGLWLLRSPAAVILLSLAGMAGALGVLAAADGYRFAPAEAEKNPVRRAGRTGNLFLYLLRYLAANKSYLLNTAGLGAMACFLPWALGAFPGWRPLPLGFGILSLNTPLCTLLSGDPELEQAVRALPGQIRRFCLPYGLFLALVQTGLSGIYLASWQILLGGVRGGDVVLAVLFALHSAALSVALEWRWPLRGWKTESDLWHHPRKYLVPLWMLGLAALLS